MYEIKYRSPDEMKDSGVEWLGSIPEDWDIQRAKVYFTQSFTKGNKHLTLLSATQNNGVVPKDSLEGIVQVKEDANLSIFKTVHAGDYVISLRSFQGGFEMSNFEGVITPAYTVFRAKKPINNSFFRFLFKSYNFITKLNSLTVGIRDGKNILFEDFANLLLPIPPLYIQQKISDFLDIKTAQFDSIISKKELLIKKLEEAKKSLISEVVTGKVKIVDGQMNKRQPEEMKDSGVEWLGMIPRNWVITKVKYYYDVQLGKMLQPNKKSKRDTLEKYLCTINVD
ncbi:MAG: hypothetical protein GX550_05050, partial [Syntrophomonadaceae bacterium]|nr:hypothetical protein [Syntrophomonadaceae bacterium]